MVGEAHDGYHMVVFLTVVVAALSPLGETIAAALRLAGVSALPPVAAEFLTATAVLTTYSLLGLVGIGVVYLAVRPLYCRTTEKRPPLPGSLLGLSQASLLHFWPAYVVVLLTTSSRWPVVTGLFVALVLVVAVPVVRALYNHLLVDTRAPTDAERALVTAGDLPGDVDVRVGPDDYDNHQIAVSDLIAERPQVFLGGDVFADLSDDCIRSILRFSYRHTGWEHTLETRAPVALWIGTTAAVLIQLEVGFLLSVGALVCSYLLFAFPVAPLLDRWLAATPDDTDAELAAAFEEFAETWRVPLEAYIDPEMGTIEAGSGRSDSEGPGEPAEP